MNKDKQNQENVNIECISVKEKLLIDLIKEKSNCGRGRHSLYGLTPVTGKKCQGIETHTGGFYRPS